MIRLRRYGQFVEIHGLRAPVRKQLHAALFSCQHSAATDSGSNSHAFVGRKKLLFLHPETNEWCVHAGLGPVLRQFLVRHGHAVKGDLCLKSLTPAPEEQLKGFAVIDAEVLALVGAADRGVIRYGRPHVSPGRLIGQVACAWPRIPIIACVTRLQDARKLQRQLKKLTGENVGLATHEDKIEVKHRISVATYRHAARGDMFIEHRRILFAVDAHEMVRDEVGAMILERAHHARLYGLVPLRERLAPYDRDMLSAFFGMRQLGVPNHGVKGRGADVRFLRFKGGRRIHGDADHVGVKRQLIWGFNRRNRYIADLATGLQRRDFELLRRYRLSQTDFADQELRKATKAILVENVEHGLALARLLPGWTLLASPGLDETGLCIEDQFRLAQGRRIQGLFFHRVIATAAALPTAGPIDIVIRADGGTGRLGLECLISISANTICPALLILDICDRHHSLLRRWSKRRADAYREAGWSLPGEEPTSVDRFLAWPPREMTLD